MSKTLVTGATGFIGSHLVRALLDRGDCVTALVCDDDPRSIFFRTGLARRVTVVRGRVEEWESIVDLIAQGGFDTVFHLAAQALVGVARHDPFLTLETNVRGTYHVLEACRRLSEISPRIVIASSDKAYGSTPDLPTSEDAPLDARHPYDVSKACADRIAHSYAATYGLDIAIARCGNVVGPGDLNFCRLVPGTIRDLLEERRPVIRSDGTPRRDWLAVDDAVAAYLALDAWLAHGHADGRRRHESPAFNFSPERPRTVLDIVETLQRLTERTDLAPVIEGAAQDEIPEQHLDATRGQRELNWRAETDLDTCLDEAVAWYRVLLGAHPSPARVMVR